MELAARAAWLSGPAGPAEGAVSEGRRVLAGSAWSEGATVPPPGHRASRRRDQRPA